jgi:hypothetical protein
VARDGSPRPRRPPIKDLIQGSPILVERRARCTKSPS